VIKPKPPTVTATLLYCAIRYQIQRPSRTWPAIESSLSQVQHTGTRRRGYVISLGQLGRVKIGGYGCDLLVTFFPLSSRDGLSHPADVVAAQLDELNRIISRGIGYNLTCDHQLDHAVIEYVADYAKSAVYQSVQQWQQHHVIHAAPVLCNFGNTSITHKYIKPVDERGQQRDARLPSRVTVVPHDRQQRSQLRIRVEIRGDVLSTTINRSRVAKWTVRELFTQHQQLHRRVIAGLLDHLSDYRPSRCVLAPASWPSACKRAFASWVAGRGATCDIVTWRRMDAYGVAVGSRIGPREADEFAARLLTAADLRAASAPCPLCLRPADPDHLAQYEHM